MESLQKLRRTQEWVPIYDFVRDDLENFLNIQDHKIIIEDEHGNAITDVNILDDIIENLSNHTYDKKNLIQGIILIQARYHPNESPFDLLNKIVSKLYNCECDFDTVIETPIEKMVQAYEELLDAHDLENILDNFSYHDLGVYGW
jgi:hypothetical protein